MSRTIAPSNDPLVNARKPKTGRGAAFGCAAFDAAAGRTDEEVELVVATLVAISTSPHEPIINRGRAHFGLRSGGAEAHRFESRCPDESPKYCRGRPAVRLN